MKYTGIEKAVFLERPNRFIAYVNGIRGQEEVTETVHVKIQDGAGSCCFRMRKCTCSIRTIQTGRRNGI